ncbi:MAG TPA: outer membrane beta-barrel protein [Bacteroidia bacterium]|nr:outer membrane beta-barrel protein [Bacteroidia bacterium]
MKKFTLIICFIIPLFAFAAKVFNGGTIKGILLDENKNALPFSTVMLKNAADSSLYKGEITNDKGEFLFENIKEGNFYIEIQVIGFKKLKSNLFSVSAEHSEIDLGTFVSEPQSSELGVVTVKGDKPFIERQVDKMVVNIENSIVQTGSTIMEVMEKLPGVLVNQDDQISLKGKQGVIILIDGKQTGLSGSDLANMLKGLPSNSIQKIEIITNPSSKYDASGNAGIINIIMKKNKQQGFNGSISAGYGQGRYGKFNTSLSLNYKNKWYNLFLNYSYSKRKGFNNLTLDRTFPDSANNSIILQTNNYITFPFETHNPRLGADFYVSKKSTLSILGTSVVNRFNPQGASRTYIVDENFNPISNSRFTNNSKDKWYNYALNAEFRTQFDTTGKELTVSVDYAKYWNNTNQAFSTMFYNNEGDLINQTFLNGKQNGLLNLFAAKADYTHPLKKDAKFEMGAKSSYVTSDNNVKFYDNINNEFIFDTARSSHFLYSENINAAYLNYNKTIHKLSLQFGLRAEQTVSNGKQVLDGQTFHRNFMQVFPTAFIQYKMNDKHDFNINLGRRIDRPGYNQLNPFRRLIDATTYSEGNPYLLPQLTYNLELTYAYKNTFFITPGYSISKNNIIDALIQDSQTRKTVQTTVNINQYNYYSLNIIFTKRLTPWWTTNTSFLSFYNEYKGTINNNLVNNSTPSFSATTNNSFSIRDGLSMECGFQYNHKSIYGITMIKSLYNLSIGIQQQLFKKQLTLTVNVNDLLWKNYPSGVTVFNNVDERWTSKRDTRVINTTLSYKFGKGKAGRMRRQTGADEEKQRIQNG